MVKLLDKKRKKKIKLAEPSQKQKTEEQLAIKNQASVEEVVDDEVEEEHEEEVEDDDEDDSENENRMVMAATSGSGNQGDGKANAAVRVKYLLKPLSKEVLLNILSKVAAKHVDVANEIQEIADKEPAHREIFVYGCSSETRITLVNFFEQYGEIENIKVITDKVSGKSKGCAFIRFKSGSGARNALQQPQKKIGTCRLASKGPDPVANSLKKIYVGNVGPELDPQKLLEYFSRYGEIEEGPLGLNKFTGRADGFCLFIYKSPESAKKALEEPYKNFEGHTLRCEKGMDGPKPGKQQHHHHNNQHHNDPRYQRNDYSCCSTPGGYGHLMASNQAVMGGPAALQAFPAFLASQGGGFGFNHPAIGQPLFGSYGTATANGAGMPTCYGAQAMTPGTMPGYGTHPGLQGGYQTPPPIQGSTGSGQHSVRPYGSQYMGL